MKDMNNDTASGQAYASYETGEKKAAGKKKKNIFVRAGLWIALICFVLGLVSFAVGSAFGGVGSIMAESSLNPILSIGEFSWGSGAVMDRDTVFEEITAGTHIEKLELDINYGDIVIEQGDVMEVSAANVSESHYKCEYKNGILTILDAKKINWLTGDNIKHQGKQLIITMPENVVIDEMECSVGAGELKADYLQCADASIDIGAGKGWIGTLITTGELDLEVGAGEITVDNLQAKESSFDCGAGRLEIQGDVTGDISVDCGVGEVEMTLASKAREYNYSVDCGMGEVSIDGENYKSFLRSGGHHSDHGNGGCEVEVDCGIGSVRIDFQ